MKRVQVSPKQVVWLDEQVVSSPLEKLFCSKYWHAKQRVVGQAQGRGTTWFIKLDYRDAALRHYLRGGLFGRLIRDHYLFLGWERTRGVQELLVLNHLHRHGVNVPRPIAARAVKRLFCYQADILVERVSEANDLVTVLKKNVLNEQQCRDIGVQIALMHRAQVNHTDLNIHNILLDSEQRIWLIDFDKCRVEQGERWKFSNLNRLKRSFAKEQEKHNIHWHASHWMALLEGYHHG
ncbi:3-deoxy-D-manno-octulosonic acid kinase [Vibrio parahaemolyticus]|uniref:3-deoxy-D-manno-octulosonic acid kinase n=1 Tax=Vibrio parahaemolyticus TaxID=670 RepID=UPI0009469D38|nr:3-deoxy-D-manno-octulosonic acid kinase [Vibrio parahaemolyticus]EIA1494908.1 3-deoxy-D-manno-octulosonic acid kinase [Vibrio parahaemolyticus]ELA7321831.1 3-deoxy-D-manno-octulosonic acid kinase [Vibrio parahaemolyticus]ELA9322409.1 3-deoxy-D-manno-octulosonic acid kinase [Vibrio parahaemolyticus]ELB2241424.1 3-deoxy-D-manno-octulosonic acid kinase [Vibrio parahaemolyticus]MBE3859082.1 3-deoxy-D-manno-octulosonic acid kinase [Vibrio parahaemolyticus]